MKYLLLAILALALVRPAPAAQLPGLDSLDQFIQQTMAEWQVPGLAVAIVKDGRVEYARGYGVRDLDTRAPVTPQTLFSIASCTKAFTATTAAMLVQDSLIAWDTPLRAYAPDFASYDSVATARLTLRDLLCHRSGVGEQAFYRMNEAPSRAELLARWRYFEPTADFRAIWQYNNLGYTVAGELLARRAHTEWEELVRTRLLQPLGMTHTVFSVRAMQAAPDYAVPYIDYGRGPERMAFYNADVLGPAGAMVSTADDLSKWVLFQLAKGQVDGKPLVKLEHFAVTRTAQMPLRPTADKEILCRSYGLGWMIDAYRGTLHVHHGGLLYGFTALVSLLPLENTGLVVLTNLNGTPLPAILEGYIYDRLLGLAPVDWNRRRREQEQRLQALMATEDARLDSLRCHPAPLARKATEYTGTYHHPGYGDITLRATGDSLAAALTTLTCPLLPTAPDSFELYNPISRQTWPLVFAPGGNDYPPALSLSLGTGAKDIVFRRTDPLLAPQ